VVSAPYISPECMDDDMQWSRCRTTIQYSAVSRKNPRPSSKKTKWRPNIYQNKKLTKTPINLLLISQRLTFITTSSSFFIRF
jgi:hypothetical protein